MLTAGLDVVLVERDAAAAEAARGRVAAALEAAVRRGLPEAGRAAALARFRTTLAMADLAGADLVIEAVFEDLEVKQAVFRDLDRVCKPGAVLASNTSYLDIGRIAAATARPGDVLGLHFFSPANIMRLVEVVVAPQSAADAVATGFALARRAGKVAVRAGVCDGFIGNRILAQCSRAAQAMVLHGAAPQAVDAALVAFGYPMGPFAVADLAGLDIGWAGRRRRLAERQGDDPRYPAAWLDRLCEAGRFGQKTGRGIYRYPDGARRGEPDPGAEAVIAAARAEAGLQPRDFTADEIVARYMGAMVNEAARVLEEGIAERPLDIDVVQMLGYGHPRWRGGPMFWADTVGLARVLDDIRRFTADDPSIWTPAPLILDLVARGAGFGVLNRPGGAAPG
jgi:3-hydroxyacyl-CoA dehydrogenase